MRKTWSLVVLLSLTSVLLLPAASSAGMKARPAKPSADAISLWRAITDPLLSLWSSKPGPGLQLKGRGTMDPNGDPAESTFIDPLSTEGRGTMDPNG